MKLNENTKNYDNVKFDDLSDKAQNQILKEKLNQQQEEIEKLKKYLKEYKKSFRSAKELFEKFFVEKKEVHQIPEKEKSIRKHETRYIFYKNVKETPLKYILFKLDQIDSLDIEKDHPDLLLLMEIDNNELKEEIENLKHIDNYLIKEAPFEKTMQEDM